MLRTGFFAIVNGVGMLVWPSRMPTWCPPVVVGVVSLVLGVVVILGALPPTRSATVVDGEFIEPPPHPALVLARVALGILAAYYLALAIGLFIGWEPDGLAPGATNGDFVTASLDRVVLYLLASGVAYDLLREPSANPVSAMSQPSGWRWLWSR